MIETVEELSCVEIKNFILIFMVFKNYYCTCTSVHLNIQQLHVHVHVCRNNSQ